MIKGFKSKVFGAPRSEAPEPPATPETAPPSPETPPAQPETPQLPAETPAAPPEATPAPAEPFRRLEDRSSPGDAVVSAQSYFKGLIKGRAGARIAGEVQGEIRCEGLVWVGETGKIKGDIASAYVILEGELEGNIGPSLHVELRSSARMRGNIDTKVLAIADGTSFEGQVNMPTTKARPERPSEKRHSGSGRN